MHLLTISLIIGVLTSCASMPGGVSVSTSKYDGSKQVYMKPGWANLDGTTRMKIGAVKTSKMKKDEYILIVRHDEIKRFSPKHPNFFIKVDDNETPLSPISGTLECKISSQSDVAHCSEQYLISRDLLNRLNSNETRFKLILNGGRYIEGGFEQKGPSTAFSGLQKFIQTVDKTF